MAFIPTTSKLGAYSRWERDTTMIPGSASAMIRHFAILPTVWDTESDGRTYNSIIAAFISPNFTNLWTLRLRLHALARWPVDRGFNYENWQTSGRELSMPEWEDGAKALLSRDQPPEIRIVVWLIDPYGYQNRLLVAAASVEVKRSGIFQSFFKLPYNCPFKRYQQKPSTLKLKCTSCSCFKGTWH